MPLNYQQIQNQITRYCDLTTKRDLDLRQTTRCLLGVLEQYGDRVDELIGLVGSEAILNKSLRCAKPIKEKLTSIFPLPGFNEIVTLLAADGSQIDPNRHRRNDFGLINVATICMQTGEDITPTIEIESSLLNSRELFFNKTPLTEDIIALERDIRERAALARLAHKCTRPLLTLTDGPLELFRATFNSAFYDEKLVEYIKILTDLEATQSVTVGYVDKPHSDLVKRLLILIMNKRSTGATPDITTIENTWVSDLDLFSELLTSPGDRSGIFCIQSFWSKNFVGGQGLCFFYLNLSRSEKPYLARVEIPAWCALDRKLIDMLHSTIYKQCEIMGSRPYPYILHRAHEIAIVTFEETLQLDEMIATELQRRGLNTGTISNKQSAKDLPGRGRYL